MGRATKIVRACCSFRTAVDGYKDVIDCGETKNRRNRDTLLYDLRTDAHKNCEMDVW